ncbi:glyoxalase [Pseudoclavibacter endophyticus]|uniref:VOC family protein n=1 Tax=Pseudoclavibacter endophyticus TaxID=1778590 RepID=UPI00166DCEAB|nr:VOC family protein [Pseudoclavibacter endophyticus]GGA61937.1 glyoxalase [Pseudoclavibacter endophyticus]
MNRYVHYREGQVAWVDLTTTDLSRSAAFYAELFGWDIDDLGPEAGGYRMATVATQPVAGLLQASSAHPLEAWSVYLSVDDIDDAYERAERAGAHPLVPPYALDGQGRYALVADPGGAVLGLWQGAAHHGTQIHSFAGSPGWFEIHTKGYDAACRFYREAFGLTIEPLAEDDGFRYSTARLADGSAPAFGIFDVSTSRPASMASTWTVYFLTADADRDVERAVSLGARLTFGPEDSVYGRMATFIDPQGAAFNLIEPPLPEPAPGAAAPVAIDASERTGDDPTASTDADPADDAGSEGGQADRES